MKKANVFKRKPLAHWIAASVAAMSVSGLAYAAAPLAGEEIKNLATVTYEDENGNTYSAQSNEAVITVAPQYKATIDNDNSLSGAPGQTVYFPHTITNTGNILDTYNLSTDVATKIYADTNGNGQPDAGEPEITSLEVGVGEAANIVVAYQVPVTASAGDSTAITLTATSANGGTVADIGTNANTTDGDNVDTVTVSNGPVLVQNKEAVLDAANNKIRYTLTIKNTGAADATNVDIIDAIPLIDHDGDSGTDPVALTSPTVISTNGLTNTGDQVATVTTQDEAGTDLNFDGDTTDTGVGVIKALDVTLPKDTTVSIVYEASYDPAWDAGSLVENTFLTQADDPDNPGSKITTPSNKTTTTLPQSYGVTADDDGEGTTSAGVNDGQDDDGTANNDDQLVDTVVSGDTVVFTHTIENTGNGEDSFNLSIAPGTFPTGTIFTFWSADGTTQLTDSDGDGVPDTGNIDGAGSEQIVVKAQLPAGVTSAAGTNHTAILTATSSGNPEVSDDTNLVLGEITAPAVDLAAVGATQPNDGFNDDGSANAHDEGPVLNKEGQIGETVSFPMSVANESGKSDSFVLTSENVPAGWTVVYKDSSGNVLTSTPLIPAGGTFDFTAEVTISSDPQQALGVAPGSVDGYDSTDNGSAGADAGNDGDTDYVMDVKVTSATDGTRSDAVSIAVDVKDTSAVSITPNGQNQVQPGGTVEYSHTVKNDGNLNESVELTSSNGDPDWNSSTQIETPTGFVEISTLKAGDSITVYDADGNPQTVAVTDTDGDGNVEIPLAPGEYVNVVDKVFAPANAPQGDVNTTTLQATDADGTIRSTATDTSNVIKGQVRLSKSVALDAGCDGTADGAFAAIQSSQVAPGQCVIWEITAVNEGDAKVKNVVINDSIPDFTAFVPGTLRVGDATMTDATNDDAAEYNATSEKVTFYVGTSATPASQTGGELLAGESATVNFSVKVDE